MLFAFVFSWLLAQSSSYAIQDPYLRGEMPVNIHGGSEAPLDRFSYMCYLVVKDTQELVCGGTLISEKAVLTAAHCKAKVNALGITDLINKTGIICNKNSSCPIALSKKDIMDIEDFCYRSDFVPKSNAFDIAVVQLKSPIKIEKYPEIADKDVDPNAAVTVVGCGKIDDTSPLPPHLKMAYMKTVTDTKLCDLNDEDGTVRAPATINCASDSEGGYHNRTCPGDSGGPFLLGDLGKNDQCPEKDFVVGITSYVPSKKSHDEVSCTKEVPSAFTNAGTFKDWVAEVEKNWEQAPTTTCLCKICAPSPSQVAEADLI